MKVALTIQCKEFKVGETYDIDINDLPLIYRILDSLYIDAKESFGMHWDTWYASRRKRV